MGVPTFLVGLCGRGRIRGSGGRGISYWEPGRTLCRGYSRGEWLSIGWSRHNWTSGDLPPELTRLGSNKNNKRYREGYMEYIRLLHPRDFDRRRNRFTSLALRNLQGSLSVIDPDCVEGTGAGLCDHIRRYYPGITGEPPIFWRFDSSVLPVSHRVETQPSTSGDDCHRNIHGVTDGSYRAVIINIAVSNYSICCEGGTRDLTENDLPGGPDLTT